MSFTPKALADGEIPQAPEVIFTASAAVGTYVKEMALFNRNAALQTIVLYVNRTGENRTWKRFELQQFESADALDDGQTLFLESGDEVLAEASNASAVDFIMSGVEEN